ncbi:MAG: hypothetical protein IIZ73_06645, partial [Ruminococcus sp.]|nr:hypothetical protein [Ruminococcus sp.]
GDITAEDEAFFSKLDGRREQFIAAMDDDLNTADGTATVSASAIRCISTPRWAGMSTRWREYSSTFTWETPTPITALCSKMRNMRLLKRTAKGSSDRAERR